MGAVYYLIAFSSSSLIIAKLHFCLLPFYFSLYIVPRMLKRLLGALWRLSPKSLRRWSVALVEPRFMVTAGAVVTDDKGRVLMLEHRFRAGSGWGIPGGFL